MLRGLLEERYQSMPPIVLCKNLNQYMDDFAYEWNDLSEVCLKKHRCVSGHEVSENLCKDTRLVKSPLMEFVIS